MLKVESYKTLIESYEYDSYEEYENHKSELEAKNFSLLSDSYNEEKGKFTVKYEKIID